MLHSRYVGFSQSLYESSKAHVKLLFNIVCYDGTSLTGNNLKYLREKYSITTIDKLLQEKYNIGQSKFKEMSEDDLWKIQELEELIQFRTNPQNTQLTQEQVEDLIVFLTTS